MAKATKEKLPLEELLEQALVKAEDRPYEVPNNWVWTRLGEIIKVSSGKSLTSSKMVSEGPIPVYGGNGVTGYHNAFNIEPHTLVIGRVGFYCGSVHYINENAWVTDNALIVSFLENKLNIRFLYWLLATVDLRKNDSSTAQPVISGSKIYVLETPLPPLAEQHRIVEVIESLFEKLDIAKELVQNALDSFQNRKATILYKAFTGELTAKWRKENGVSLDAWEEKKLKEVCSIITDGTHQTPTYVDKGYMFLSSKNVTSGKIDWSNIKYIPEELHEKLYSRLAPQLNDILLAKNGTTGVAAIVDRECVFDIYVSLALLRPIKYILPHYLLYAINNPMTKEKFNGELTGIGVPNLHLRDIRETTIPIPQISEQKEIVRILDILLENEQQAKELCDVIEKIDLMKKSILARAFRGELGTNNPQEESAVELLKEVLKEKI